MVKRSAPAESASKSSSKKAKVASEPASSTGSVKKAKDAVVKAVKEVVPAATTPKASKNGESKKVTEAPKLNDEFKKGKEIAEAKHGKEAPAVASTVTKKRKTAEDFLDSAPAPKSKDLPTTKKAKPATVPSPAPTPAIPADPAPKPLKSSLKKSILSKPTAAPSPSTSTSTRPTRSTTTKPSSASASNPSRAAYIAGFSSSESGSDDESDGDVDMDGPSVPGRATGEERRRIDVGSLPTIAKDDKTVMRKLEKAKRKNDKQRGVLYLGRIPHGFYEEEMKSYFTQFGDVTRLRLSRNKKTGASKHYAYIEFSSKSVAEITAETMNNYLLMGHILQCHLISNDEVHADLFIGANRKYQAPPAELQAMRLKTLKMGDEKVRAKANARLMKRDEKRQEKIKALGIDYEFKL